MPQGDPSSPDKRPHCPWLGRTVLGIVLGTFFSDFGHEMATAVLPLYLMAIGLGPGALGLIEGVADFAVSLSKLAGGVTGHYVRRKQPWVVLGYLITAVATSAMGLVKTAAALTALRATAWIGRGYRSPLRDYLLADAVEATHYGRAYGLERAGDMLGAVAGPLGAALLVGLGLNYQSIILLALGPGLLAAGSMAFVVRERIDPPALANSPPGAQRRRFPTAFWLFLVGVGLFGLGDFSRTLIIYLAAHALGGSAQAAETVGTLSTAVLLYALHNLTSAAAAFPIGQVGDRQPKLAILVVGYAIGVGTNVLLAAASGSLGWLVAAIVLSGIYIAAEETLEKAAAAEFLPRELKSLGFGILACVNAVGDMVSSLTVGWLLEAGRPTLGFALAATVGAVGTLWLAGLVLARRRFAQAPLPPGKPFTDAS